MWTYQRNKVPKEQEGKVFISVSVLHKRHQFPPMMRSQTILLLRSVFETNINTLDRGESLGRRTLLAAMESTPFFGDGEKSAGSETYREEKTSNVFVLPMERRATYFQFLHLLLDRLPRTDQKQAHANTLKQLVKDS